MSVVYRLGISEPVKLIGEGEYNLDALREVRVTDFFLGLDQKTRGCQDNEQLLNCSTKKYLIHNSMRKMKNCYANTTIVQQKLWFQNYCCTKQLFQEIFV